jgi:hypothetical protein
MIFLLLLIFLCQSAESQISKDSLVGYWNAKSDTGGSYNFTSENTFSYYPQKCGLDELDRVIRINGKYYLSGDSLFLRISSSFEKVGGKFIYGYKGGRWVWFLKKEEIKIITQDSSDQSILKISSMLLNDRVHIIQIDDVPYYKIIGPIY